MTKLRETRMYSGLNNEGCVRMIGAAIRDVEDQPDMDVEYQVILETSFQLSGYTECLYTLLINIVQENQ